MKKYNINFKNLSMLNFEEFYTAIVKKTRYIKFKYNLTKIMRENAFKKLNYQKKLFMKNNIIIMYVNNIFSSHQQLKLTKKSKSKIILNTII